MRGNLYELNAEEMGREEKRLVSLTEMPRLDHGGRCIVSLTVMPGLDHGGHCIVSLTAMPRLDHGGRCESS